MSEPKKPSFIDASRPRCQAESRGAVLVTGASGYIGSVIAARLAKLGYEVVAAGGANPVPDFVRQAVHRTIQLDLANTSSLAPLKEHYFSAAIHCAAISTAPKCETDPACAHVINTASIPPLLESVSNRSDQPPLFVLLSTDLVFDGAKAPQGGFVEADSPCCASVYSRTKVASESFVLNAPNALGIALRIGLTYGPKQEHSQGVMGWMENAFAAHSPVSVFLDEYRTPLFVEDLAVAAAKLIEHPPVGAAADDRIFHLGGPRRVSRAEFGETFARVMGFDRSLIRHVMRSSVPITPPRPEDVSLNSDRFVTRYKLVRHSIEEAFEKMRT